MATSKSAGDKMDPFGIPKRPVNEYGPQINIFFRRYSLGKQKFGRVMIITLFEYFLLSIFD